MTRWKPKHTKDQVIELFERRVKEQPKISSFDLAAELKCSPSYIRATLARAGIKLPRSKRKKPSLCGINQPKAG